MNATQSKSASGSPAPASRATLYLVCLVISVAISWGIFAQFLLADSASVSQFFKEAFASPIATLVSSDVLLSAGIFLLFARIELNRLKMPSNRLALYVLVTSSVGVCGALSLFLYQRENWLAKNRK
ncbi:MAG: DUF2834 domain-containing protein [Cyanobacteria bacterium P01_C01_bin.121]